MPSLSYWYGEYSGSNLVILLWRQNVRLFAKSLQCIIVIHQYTDIVIKVARNNYFCLQTYNYNSIISNILLL